MFKQLTKRQKQIADLMVRGHSNIKIAETLGIAIGTVKKLREQIYEKLDVHDVAALTKLALKNGDVFPIILLGKTLRQCNLSERRFETLVAIANGNSVKEAAALLRIAAATLDRHRQLLHLALGLTGQTGNKTVSLVHIAYSFGLLNFDEAKTIPKAA